MYKGLSITEKLAILDDMEKQEQQAYMAHNDMELIAIYDSIVGLKKDIITGLVSSYGSGYISGIIGSTKYTQIDKAVNKTLLFLYNATEEQLHGLSVDNASIAQLITKCYRATEEIKNGRMIPVIN